MDDVELEYDEDDFANLTTFKLFCDGIKPLVVADQPKLSGSKLNKFLQAKYREFVMQVPPMERDNYDKAGVGEWHIVYCQGCAGLFLPVINIIADNCNWACQRVIQRPPCMFFQNFMAHPVYKI